MLNLPAAIILAKNKLSDTSPWLVTAEMLLGGIDNVKIVSNNENITVDGDVYTAFPFQLEPISNNSGGELTSASIAVGNANRALQYYVELYNGCVDSQVTVRIFNANYLTYANVALTWSFIIMSSVCTSETITFSLGARNPLRMKFPPYRYFNEHCKWIFKSAECDYTRANLTCDRTLAACELKNNTLRFGGCPGLAPGSFRIA